MKWKDLIDENPGQELNDRILRQANAELLRLRQSSQVALPFWRRRAFVSSLGFGLAALAFFKVFGPAKDKVQGSALPESVALQDAELLNNIDLLNQLEMFEDFEILEKWNGSDV